MRGSELGSRVHSSIFIVNPDAEFCLDTWSLGLYVPLGLQTNLQDCRLSRIWGFKYQPFWVYLPEVKTQCSIIAGKRDECQGLCGHQRPLDVK